MGRDSQEPEKNEQHEETPGGESGGGSGGGSGSGGGGSGEDKRAAAVVRLDQIARSFASYEDFLDSQITEMDMFYLEDRSIARTIKELGFHGDSEKITREQFNDKKSELIHTKRNEQLKSGARYLYTDRDAFLLELARREDANLCGRLVTVIYLRDRNAKGQEISSYIDYAQRLHQDDFAGIFSGSARLTAKTSDLSHFNWDTNVTHSNNSPNFHVIFQGHGGIRLKCKKDRRIVHLDPTRQVAHTNIEDTTRTLIRSRSYAQVVIFDHFIRFWANEDDTPQSEVKLPTGPSSSGPSPDKERSSESADLDLFDNVTAAIYEDDLLDIARNALGGDLHQEHDGEWAPADIMADGERRPSFKRGAVNESALQSTSLEESVLGTMKDLYDAHKNDLSFGTLGNFTFIQMIEQLNQLLPAKARAKVHQEVVKIGEGMANVTVKVPEQDLPADEVVEVYEKIPISTDTPSHLVRDPAGQKSEDPLASLISGSHAHLGQEAPPPELFPTTTRANVKTLFDPAPHMDAIKQLYPKKSGPTDSTAERSGTERRKRCRGEELGGAKDHSEYFKQLETRMELIFQGAVKDELNQLPLHPKTFDMPDMPAGEIKRSSVAGS